MGAGSSPRATALIVAVLSVVASWIDPAVGELEHAAAHRGSADTRHAVASDDDGCSPLAHWHAATERVCDGGLACLERPRSLGVPDRFQPTEPASEPANLQATPPAPTLARQRGATRGRAPPSG